MAHFYRMDVSFLIFLLLIIMYLCAQMRKGHKNDTLNNSPNKAEKRP